MPLVAYYPSGAMPHWQKELLREPLNAGETATLRATMKGATTRATARALGVSPSTVSMYRNKLGFLGFIHRRPFRVPVITELGLLKLKGPRRVTKGFFKGRGGRSCRTGLSELSSPPIAKAPAPDITDPARYLARATHQRTDRRGDSSDEQEGGRVDRFDGLGLRSSIWLCPTESEDGRLLIPFLVPGQERFLVRVWANVERMARIDDGGDCSIGYDMEMFHLQSRKL